MRIVVMGIVVMGIVVKWICVLLDAQGRRALRVALFPGERRRPVGGDGPLGHSPVRLPVTDIGGSKDHRWWFGLGPTAQNPDGINPEFAASPDPQK